MGKYVVKSGSGQNQYIDFNKIPANYGFDYIYDCALFQKGDLVLKNKIENKPDIKFNYVLKNADGSIELPEYEYNNQYNQGVLDLDKTLTDITIYMVFKIKSKVTSSSTYRIFLSINEENNVQYGFACIGSYYSLGFWRNGSSYNSNNISANKIDEYCVVALSQYGNTTKVFHNGNLIATYNWDETYFKKLYFSGRNIQSAYFKNILIANINHKDDEIIQNSLWLMEQNKI